MEWTHFNRALVSLAWGSPQIKICLRVCWQAEGTDSFRQCHGDMVLTTSEEVVSRHTQLSIQSLWPMKPSSAGCGPTQSRHWALHLPVHPSDTGAGQSPAQPHCTKPALSNTAASGYVATATLQCGECRRTYCISFSITYFKNDTLFIYWKTFKYICCNLSL